MPRLDHDGPELTIRLDSAENQSRILDSLNDADCRTILTDLSDPKSAANLAHTCDIPISTVYRKLKQLTKASLVEKTYKPNQHGHTALYSRRIQNLRVELDGE